MARRDVAGGKKKADETGETIVFVDESGFYLLPSVVRTWAPRGETPILRGRLTRDHLSAISGITPEGELYLRVQEEAYNASGVVGFLKHLLAQIPGRILVLWDRSRIHRAQVVKSFLASPEGERLRTDHLPAYAPELNPDELVWRHLKYVELRNVRCGTLRELRANLRRAVRRLRRKPGTLAAFVEHLDHMAFLCNGQ
jgi:transposase